MADRNIRVRLWESGAYALSSLGPDGRGALVEHDGHDALHVVDVRPDGFEETVVMRRTGAIVVTSHLEGRANGDLRWERTVDRPGLSQTETWSAPARARGTWWREDSRPERTTRYERRPDGTTVGTTILPDDADVWRSAWDGDEDDVDGYEVGRNGHELLADGTVTPKRSWRRVRTPLAEDTTSVEWGTETAPDGTTTQYICTTGEDSETSIVKHPDGTWTVVTREIGDGYEQVTSGLPDGTITEDRPTGLAGGADGEYLGGVFRRAYEREAPNGNGDHAKVEHARALLERLRGAVAAGGSAGWGGVENGVAPAILDTRVEPPPASAGEYGADARALLSMTAHLAAGTAALLTSTNLIPHG